MTRPVAGEMTPGMPIADRAGPDRRFRVRHERGDRVDRAVVVAARRRHPFAEHLAAGLVERDRFDLGAAEVDADARAPDRHRRAR